MIDTRDPLTKLSDHSSELAATAIDFACALAFGEQPETILADVREKARRFLADLTPTQRYFNGVRVPDPDNQVQ